MNTTREPVAIGGALQALVSAVIAFLIGFDVVEWTDEQVGLVLALYIAFSAVVTAVQRSKVSPVQ